MWIVRLALRRPYTFTVAALLIIILGLFAASRMAKDIFPNIDIPVVAVVWTYNGLSPDEMSKRIVTISERAMTTTVNGIEHIESQSFDGIAVIKVFLQQGASVEAAIAQIASTSQTVVRSMPPGTTPPDVVRYTASNVPILQMGLGSQTLTEQQLFDLGLNFVRVPLATVQGASIPLPLGGKIRQIMVDLNPKALQAYGLTPTDVNIALNAQNLTLPSGRAKIGPNEFKVLVNSSPDKISGLNDLPIKKVNGATIYIRDVAQVRDGFADQTNIVRQDGTRGTLLTVLKSGGASTLDVIQGVKAALPRIKAGLPSALTLKPLLDQSVFVQAALNGVLKEGSLAAALTALMILLFLGEWRSTLVVALSIPLSIFFSIICLSAFGQTINSMTLGGLALAVGILVDDATVTIENIDRNLAMGKRLVLAILDGAEQIAVPAFVSTLCICIVFIPIFFLSGTAKYLFSPMAMSVIFAMIGSYLLSRTVVPTMINYLLGGQSHHVPSAGKKHNPIYAVHLRFNVLFEKFRASYGRGLTRCLKHQKTVMVGAAVFVILTLGLIPFLGRDFFPLVDAGQFRLHVRVPAGTRIEETERAFTQVENVIREVIPAQELETILDDIGLPNGGLTLAFSDTATIGTSDGEILVSLNPKQHGSTWNYVKILRDRLNRQFPTYTFFTQPSDIVGQILNFGLPAPIDIQIAGRSDLVTTYALANELAGRITKIPGAVDVHIHQVVNTPALRINVDRTRAEQMGLSQRDIANNLLISLSGSGQTTPNYWLSPQNGVQYLVATQTPVQQMDSINAIANTPVSGVAQGSNQMLGNVATVSRDSTQAIVSHYNVQPVFDVYANVQGHDLGSVADQVTKLLPEFQKRLPQGNFITMRGQVGSMNSSFLGLGVGVLGAIVLVYFLMVVNFQSWLDPFIIIMALPGAICGILWILFATGTTLNVPSLMGAIMSVGVATANSILVVTFANDQRISGKSSLEAAMEAGLTRLRPVLMTALAMIIGMLPMSLGLGEGGEQNAPLGRAVIGGLLFATFATLFLVPVVYAMFRKQHPFVVTDPLLDEGEQQSTPAAEIAAHP